MFFAKRYAYDCTKEKNTKCNVNCLYDPTHAKQLQKHCLDG